MYINRKSGAKITDDQFNKLESGLKAKYVRMPETAKPAASTTTKKTGDKPAEEAK